MQNRGLLQNVNSSYVLAVIQLPLLSALQDVLKFFHYLNGLKSNSLNEV